MNEVCNHVHFARSTPQWLFNGVVAFGCFFIGSLGSYWGGQQLGYNQGFQQGRESHQNLNDLLSVGFVLTDPDGYEVERFDDDSQSTVRHTTSCYWTTTDKPH